MSDLLRKSLQSPRAIIRAIDTSAPSGPGVTGGVLKPGELVWYFYEEKKFPATVLATHPNMEEIMIQYWDLGRMGEKLGKEMREKVVPLTTLARRDKYAIPPSPKPNPSRKTPLSAARQHPFESKDSMGTIGSALDVKEYSLHDSVLPSPSIDSSMSSLSASELKKLESTFSLSDEEDVHNVDEDGEEEEELAASEKLAEMKAT
jgi:hypothetical protein